MTCHVMLSREKWKGLIGEGRVGLVHGDVTNGPVYFTAGSMERTQTQFYVRIGTRSKQSQTFTQEISLALYHKLSS